MSKPCCEYDIMVLSNGDRRCEVMKLGSYWAEILYVPLKPKVPKVILDSADGIVLSDTDDLKISSMLNAVMDDTRRTSNKLAIAEKDAHLLSNETDRNRENLSKIRHNFVDAT